MPCILISNDLARFFFIGKKEEACSEYYKGHHLVLNQVENMGWWWWLLLFYIFLTKDRPYKTVYDEEIFGGLILDFGK